MSAVTFLQNKVYPILPPWAQNLGISLYGLGYRGERLGDGFEAETAAFRERDKWSTQQMDDYVLRCLRQRLLVAFDYVPYYRNVWLGIGLDRQTLSTFTPEDLPSLPITTKEAVRNDPAAFTPTGPARPHHLLKYCTSGSTGTPITCYYSPQSHRRFFAAREARSFAWAGTSIRAMRATISGRIIVSPNQKSPPFHRRNYSEPQVYLSAFHITPANAVHYVDALNRCRPAVMTGYCSCYYFLARFMLDQRLTLAYRPTALIVGSDRLTPEIRHTLESAFEAPAFEEYGSIENVVLATQCPHGCLHVSPDFGVLEIIDSEGRPSKSGNIIATGLLNDAQILIRYALGDVGTWASTHSCPCGRAQLPVLEDITGRVEDTILTADGRRVVRLHGVFYNIPHLIAAQVVQESLSLIRVRVLAQDDFSSADADIIRHRLTDERLPDTTILIERVNELEKTSRGKVRAIINRMEDRS